ncbi:hypothetical protein Fmac_011697 [Flemingia macrophylla]|uniref:Uncharacterized protein n=1 Tax=Flemingia macrophylla TaxID=520843 RepID=A0ABD1MN69_9FABA
MFFITDSFSRDMPKPKRIRNLLKSVGQTCQHESSCSDTLVGNHSLPNESPQPDLTPNAPVYTPQRFTQVNEDMAKRDVMFKIAKQWREYRIKLWNEFYDPLLSRNDLINNVPEGLSMDQWALFVDYRLKPSTMELCNRNREIRKRQTIPHTGGAMALSRRRDNLEKIDEILSQNPENISEISPNDAIGVIFGKEHPGRVRGLGLGACPTIAFKNSTTRLGGINVDSSSANTSNMEEKMVNMATELATVKSQVQTLLSYIALKE